MDAEVLQSREVGTGHLKLSLRVAGQTLSAFGFDRAEGRPVVGERVQAMGPIRPDAWAGGDAVELQIEALEKSP